MKKRSNALQSDNSGLRSTTPVQKVAKSPRDLKHCGGRCFTMSLQRATFMCVAATALLFGAAASTGFAQSQPMMPRGEFVEVKIDSGERDGPALDAGRGLVATPQVVFSHVLVQEDALWTRLYLAEVELDRGSTLRVTSLLDGEVQELDAQGAAIWSNTTAYFNGDKLLIELVAAPESSGNRIVIDRVAVEISGNQIGNHCTPPLCGICVEDDRVPSSENWAGRLMPGGCSAAIYNEQSCAVSAGHCMGSTDVLQFNVPNSTGGCNTQNPPVADQFPIAQTTFINGGVGNDWAAFTVGPNSVGQLPYDRYGQFRPIASSVPSSGSIDIWGYGVSETCTLTQTQQHSTGNITSVTGSVIYHNADTTCGNSGSSILQNGEIIGVVTHCGQPCPPESNIGTRIDVSAFQNAINSICPALPENNTCPGSIQVFAGQNPFSNIGATTNGFDESANCTFDGDGQIQSDVWFHHTATCTGTLTVSLCDGEQPQPGGDCAGFCGGQSPAGCWCDNQCDGFGDCCADVCDDCPNLTHCQSGPCAGHCGGVSPQGCWCDNSCDFFNDCCPGVCVDCPGLSHCTSGGITLSGGFDTKLAVYGHCPLGPGEVLACNKDTCGALSEVTLEVQQGQTYRIRVGGHLGAQGDGILTLDCEPGEIEDPCPADLSGPAGVPDDVVDVFDLIELINQWGPCNDPADCPADLSGPADEPDGTVDVFDLIELINNWGPCS